MTWVHAVCRAVAKVFKGKTIEKGIAFPTCVSVNKCARLPCALLACMTRHCLSCSSTATQHLTNKAIAMQCGGPLLTGWRGVNRAEGRRRREDASTCLLSEPLHAKPSWAGTWVVISTSSALTSPAVGRSDLGAHIDGFIATAAHTVVPAEGDDEAPLTGRVADLLTAAHTALEAAIRLFRPGKRISEVGRLP